MALPPGVLQVVLSLGTGGTERLVIEICTRLQARFRMAVCCLDAQGACARELTERGIQVVALNREPGFHPLLGDRIAQVAARHRASVLHCHHYSPFVYGRIAALWSPRLRLVFTEHGRLSDGAPSLKRRLVNPLLGRLPGLLCSVSSALRDSMVAEGFPGNRIQVIPNGIDPGPRPAEIHRQIARRALGIRGNTLAVGTVARLDPVKDLGSLIRAFALLRQRVDDAVLIVVGDGGERARLEAAARDCGVTDATRFLGDRADARRLLPGFDVYVNSSVSEGVSLTILEAMAAGLPVIATRAGGTPEVVADGHTGVLVAPRQPAALTSALLSLAGAPDRKRALGAAARLSVERHFAIDTMIERYARVYERLVRS